jgi:hypothetical protein
MPENSDAQGQIQTIWSFLMPHLYHLSNDDLQRTPNSNRIPILSHTPCISSFDRVLRTYALN